MGEKFVGQLRVENSTRDSAAVSDSSRGMDKSDDDDIAVNHGVEHQPRKASKASASNASLSGNTGEQLPSAWGTLNPVQQRIQRDDEGLSETEQPRLVPVVNFSQVGFGARMKSNHLRARERFNPAFT